MKHLVFLAILFLASCTKETLEVNGPTQCISFGDTLRTTYMAKNNEEPVRKPAVFVIEKDYILFKNNYNEGSWSNDTFNFKNIAAFAVLKCDTLTWVYSSEIMWDHQTLYHKWF